LKSSIVSAGFHSSDIEISLTVIVPDVGQIYSGFAYPRDVALAGPLIEQLREAAGSSPVLRDEEGRVRCGILIPFYTGGKQTSRPSFWRFNPSRWIAPLALTRPPEFRSLDHASLWIRQLAAAVMNGEIETKKTSELGRCA